MVQGTTCSVTRFTTPVKISSTNFFADAVPRIELVTYIVHSLYQVIEHIREKHGWLALN